VHPNPRRLTVRERDRGRARSRARFLPARPRVGAARAGVPAPASRRLGRTPTPIGHVTIAPIRPLGLRRVFPAARPRGCRAAFGCVRGVVQAIGA
jgi:hypothetical protein